VLRFTVRFARGFFGLTGHLGGHAAAPIAS
jgi:hypothetical protein